MSRFDAKAATSESAVVTATRQMPLVARGLQICMRADARLDTTVEAVAWLHPDAISPLWRRALTF
jgi:hypothetical protein